MVQHNPYSTTDNPQPTSEMTQATSREEKKRGKDTHIANSVGIKATPPSFLFSLSLFLFLYNS
jgi:hypothetical protein